MLGMIISSKFNFQVAGLKVKVTVATFRKTVIALALHLSIDFNISSQKLLVIVIPQESSTFRLLGTRSR